jgi:hypothetical protein
MDCAVVGIALLSSGNGCAGDVRLDKDDRGYEYWGLIPHVSFRDSELMQALTGQRQSGGVSPFLDSPLPRFLTEQERSYSTIMYLMALSEMARVPFSLVDEINQVSYTGCCVVSS